MPVTRNTSTATKKLKPNFRKGPANRQNKTCQGRKAWQVFVKDPAGGHRNTSNFFRIGSVPARPGQEGTSLLGGPHCRFKSFSRRCTATSFEKKRRRLLHKFGCGQETVTLVEQIGSRHRLQENKAISLFLRDVFQLCNSVSKTCWDSPAFTFAFLLLWFSIQEGQQWIR